MSAAPRLRASVVAIGAVSPLGAGDDATDVTRAGEPARVAIQQDDALVSLGFARPFCARAPREVFEGAGAADRATVLLDRATDLALEALVAALPRALERRVGLVLGTSSGGMCTAEALFERRARGAADAAEVARGATYFAPFARARGRLAERGVRVVRSTHLVTACAASSFALGVGLRWLEAGYADLILAGGYDALCAFVAAGFESLRATTASRPAPFRVGRDGMSLGEGAGVVALVREGDEQGAPARFYVSGFGASTDAVHITAPDRTGGGVARAARAALADASLEAGACGVVSAHATSTPYNDAMESRAIREVFGAFEPVVHPFKAQIGHTLGAAGILETLALARAIEAQVAPAAAGAGALDPDASVRLLERAEPMSFAVGLKISAAFGGANASLVVEHPRARPRTGPRARRAVYLKAIARAREADVDAISAESLEARDKLSRADALSLLLATPIARLGRARVQGGGVIVGHFLATLDINERFYARVLAKGPTAAEPRLFPPTSPNLMPGQVAIFFGLTGPSAAIASGLGGALDPLSMGAELVRFGDAERMVVSSVDLLGPSSTFVLEYAFPEARGVATGAVAALLDADPSGALAEVPEDLGHLVGGDGHEALAEALEVLRGDR
ncbi:MAG: 3-oxoacyl-ACP synthase [Polyangiaceae bacterium]|nr:3-oxoacyl-ACP synthase [Polyangiaceae bacterium]MBK8938781.1 3-oxoacyl-ACP synthase [Polyangiaceae bacterium]